MVEQVERRAWEPSAHEQRPGIVPPPARPGHGDHQAHAQEILRQAEGSLNFILDFEIQIHHYLF